MRQIVGDVNYADLAGLLAFVIFKTVAFIKYLINCYRLIMSSNLFFYTYDKTVEVLIPYIENIIVEVLLERH